MFLAEAMTYNWYLLLPSGVCSINRIRQGLALAPCQDNVTEWDIGLWRFLATSKAISGQVPTCDTEHYSQRVNCAVPRVCSFTSRYLFWNDFTCCKDVKLQQPAQGMWPVAPPPALLAPNGWALPAGIHASGYTHTLAPTHVGYHLPPTHRACRSELLSEPPQFYVGWRHDRLQTTLICPCVVLTFCQHCQLKYTNSYLYAINKMTTTLKINPPVRLTVAYIRGEAKWARWRHWYRVVSDSTVIVTIIK